MKSRQVLVTLAIASFFHLSSASLLQAAEPAHAAHSEQAHAAAWSAVQKAVAVLHPTANNHAQGRVLFVQNGEAVKVTVDMEGLTPGQHAIHIHEFGDCTAPDAMSAGGHYNPEGHPHALPNDGPRHAGDLGNLEADSSGKAHYEITVHNISIAGTKNPIIGRAVIVHAKADDGSQPVGNAGGRVACGVIGVAKP